jgi:hypothetical protein
MKALPSACESVPELAGYLAMVEIYTSIPKFHRTLPLQPSIGHSFATKESRISTYRITYLERSSIRSGRTTGYVKGLPLREV